MKANVKMGIKLECMKKPSHAVSTCSPDCPTDSAVERALVDLEWRREAAGKRNGNTHRINTEVLNTENATAQRECIWPLPTLAYLLVKRNGCWIWMNNCQSLKPPCSFLNTAIKHTRHDKGILQGVPTWVSFSQNQRLQVYVCSTNFTSAIMEIWNTELENTGIQKVHLNPKVTEQKNEL